MGTLANAGIGFLSNEKGHEAKGQALGKSKVCLAVVGAGFPAS